MRHELRVSLKPKMHKNYMQYYWQVVLITEDGTFTVGDGWESNIAFALEDAEEWINNNLEV